MVSGIASAGRLTGSKVRMYKFENGQQTKIGETTTNSDGSYRINIGSHSGPVLVEISDGTYIDEATGRIVHLNTTLRAVKGSVSGNDKVMVTPVTDMAYSYAKDKLGGLDQAKIEAANSAVASALGVTDIVNTPPSDVSSADSAKDDQKSKAYGLVLASISQMGDLSTVLSSLKDDLKKNDGLVDNKNKITQALQTFADSKNNQTGINSSATDVSSMVSAISAGGGASPNAGKSDADKAKGMISDLRTTIRSLKTGGINGVLSSSFNAASAELKTKIEPELAGAGHRFGMMVHLLKEYLKHGNGQTGTFNIPNYMNKGNIYDITITVNQDHSGGSFTVKDHATGATLDTGTLTLQYGSGSSTIPISGNYTSTSTTATGTLTINVSYTGTVTNGMLSSAELTGSISNNSTGAVFDFSKDGRKLSITFALEPNSTSSIYPTSFLFAGRITTKTMQLDGTLSVPTIVWNSSMKDPMPKEASFTGGFQALNSDGTASGVSFTGKIAASLTNADTYNYKTSSSSSNYPIGEASFDGTISAPSMATLNVFLKVSEKEYRKQGVYVSYTKKNTDKTMVSISGSGTIDDSAKTTTAMLTNQDGIVVSLSFNNTKSKNEKFSGTITSSGGTQLATLYTVSGIQTIKYNDGQGSVESIF